VTPSEVRIIGFVYKSWKQTRAESSGGIIGIGLASFEEVAVLYNAL